MCIRWTEILATCVLWHGRGIPRPVILARKVSKDASIEKCQLQFKWVQIIQTNWNGFKNWTGATTMVMKLIGFGRFWLFLVCCKLENVCCRDGDRSNGDGLSAGKKGLLFLWRVLSSGAGGRWKPGLVCNGGVGGVHFWLVIKTYFF